jgi:hypothetical protein
MEDRHSQVLREIRQTHRCRRDVEEMAQRMKDLSEDDYGKLIERFVSDGEDQPLGILLAVCAVNGIRIDPSLLASALPVVEPLIDFTLPYRFQDGSAIGALIQAAEREDVSWERQALAGRIAAELAVRFHTDAQSVRKTLLKLKTKIHSSEAGWMMDLSLSLLDGKEAVSSSGFCLLDRDPLKELPEERDPLVIGAGFTVRRPVPKLSRNAPCHCGSGKKYKKCCYDKDQELLRDASPYEGVTMTQVRAAPEEVADPSLIEEMRAYELKKLNLAKLNPDQLFAAYRRADLFGLRELAYAMLLELERRPGKSGFDPGHFEDLLHSALDAGDADLSERILEHIPPEEQSDPEALKTNLYLIKHREHFEGLEWQCRKAISGTDKDSVDDPLLRLAYSMERTFPALSIVFARAFIVGNPNRHLDISMLLDVIRSARVEIGLDLLGDPVEDHVDWWTDEAEEKEEEDRRSEELRRLASETVRARREVEQKANELEEKEKQLQEVISKMDEERRRVSADTRFLSTPSTDETPGDKGTVLRLRQRIESLKEEIRSQQEQRRPLRRELQAEREKALSPERPESNRESSTESDGPLTQSREVRKVLVPQYAPAFCRACESMGSPVVAKALKASVGFATNDPLVWRRTKPVQRMPGFYRIRLEKDYRLMLHWEAERKLEVLDLIPRSQLETWIRRHTQ